VGDCSISKEDLVAGYGLNAELLDESTESGRIRLEEAARRWAMDEILIREAIRRRMDQDSSFKARLHNLRRSLLIDLLFETACSAVRVDSVEILEEYDQNRENYVTSQDQIDLIYIIAPDRNRAREVQRQLLNGMALEEILPMYDQIRGWAGWRKKILVPL